MPNPMTPGLYSQLARSSNAKRLARNQLNPYMPEFYGMSDNPMEHVMNGEPQRYLPETLEDESALNALYNQVANSEYDSQQPYGFDFGQDVDEPNDGLLGEASEMALPIVRTAGSYALPMLFSMLMRGGR